MQPRLSAAQRNNDTWGTFPWWAYPWPWLALSLIVSVERWPSWTALTNRWHNHGPPASWYGTHGPRITNWGPNRGRPAPWHTVVYIDPSLRVSFSLSIPSWICERLIARLVSGISNLQQRNMPSHRQRFSWSLGYVPRIRKLIEGESVYCRKTKINKRILRKNTQHTVDSKYIYKSKTIYTILSW